MFVLRHTNKGKGAFFYLIMGHETIAKFDTSSLEQRVNGVN